MWCRLQSAWFDYDPGLIGQGGERAWGIKVDDGDHDEIKDHDNEDGGAEDEDEDDEGNLWKLRLVEEENVVEAGTGDPAHQQDDCLATQHLLMSTLTMTMMTIMATVMMTMI